MDEDIEYVIGITDLYKGTVNIKKKSEGITDGKMYNFYEVRSLVERVKYLNDKGFTLEKLLEELEE